ncbi:hypothetical protein L596_019243 [Steinernema carpocapsae]|uniref:Uncharacterized protein n=1 Tax=Steinernema carpocapsae TaxID=34508 RepID=A0A4U5MPT0_STECR|nr:hypothetical protein L596_019243 [Steinernema carpocapsae]
MDHRLSVDLDRFESYCATQGVPGFLRILQSTHSQEFCATYESPIVGPALFSSYNSGGWDSHGPPADGTYLTCESYSKQAIRIVLSIFSS